MRYVDTSVLVPFYVSEARSAEADLLLAGATDACLSDLTVAEFSVTLWRKVREGGLAEEAMQTALRALDAHCEEGLFEVHSLTRVHFLDVRSVVSATARTTGGVLRTLDALHVVAARALNASLLTFDGRLAAIARAVGINAIP